MFAYANDTQSGSDIWNIYIINMLLYGEAFFELVDNGRKIPVEIGKTIFQRATIVGSSGSPYFFPKTLTFMSRKLVDLTSVITHQFPLSDVLDAFELGNRATDSGKILLIP